jgi:hypothetical protein
MYVRVMTGLLILLWGVIAFQATHRQAPASGGIAISPAAAGAQQLDLDPILERRIGDIEFKDVEFKTAIETLERRSNADIVVLWQRIKDDLSITPHNRVNLSLYEASLHTAIHAVLRNVHPHLFFGITDRGTIVITSDDRSAPRMLAGYDIRDIAPNRVRLPTPPPPPPPPASSGGGIGGGGGGGGVFSGPSPPITVSAKQMKLVHELRDLRILSPFDDRYETIHGLFSGRLFVRETPEDHRRLRAMLRQIRKQNPGLGVSRELP